MKKMLRSVSLLLLATFPPSCTHTRISINKSDEFAKRNRIENIAVYVAGKVENNHGVVGVAESEKALNITKTRMRNILLEKGYRVTESNLVAIGYSNVDMNVPLSDNLLAPQYSGEWDTACGPVLEYPFLKEKKNLQKPFAGVFRFFEYLCASQRSDTGVPEHMYRERLLVDPPAGDISMIGKNNGADTLLFVRVMAEISYRKTPTDMKNDIRKSAVKDFIAVAALVGLAILAVKTRHKHNYVDVGVNMVLDRARARQVTVEKNYVVVDCFFIDKKTGKMICHLSCYDITDPIDPRSAHLDRLMEKFPDRYR